MLLSAETHLRAALAGRPLWPASAPAGTPAEATSFLVTDAKGAILLATDGAPALLSQYLDVPIGPDLAFGKLLERLPPALEHLVQRLRLIDSGLATKAARQVRSTRWGEISAHAYRASALPNGAQGHGQFVLVLERRPSRAAQVLGAVGRLPVAPRERHIAFLLGMEVGTAEIARRLDLTATTLRSYLRNIYDRTGAAGRDQLVALLTAGQASPAPRSH